MFRLLTTSLPVLALCLGTGSAVSAAPLETLGETPANPGILPGGCYLPTYPGGTAPAACPTGWCGTGHPAGFDDSLAWDCPNGLELEPHPATSRPAHPWSGRLPGAIREVPAMPAYSRPLPDRSVPQWSIPASGMFGTEGTVLPTRYRLEGRGTEFPERRRPALDRSPRPRPGEFRILPVSDPGSDWFTHGGPFQP